jgi:hypothetical protein
MPDGLETLPGSLEPRDCFIQFAEPQVNSADIPESKAAPGSVVVAVGGKSLF